MTACPVCRNGELKPGAATVTLERGEALIVFKGVSANVCDNCGAYFLDEKISADLLNRATEALEKGAVLEVLKLSA